MSSETFGKQLDNVLEIRDYQRKSLTQEIQRMRETAVYLEQNVEKVASERVWKESLLIGAPARRGAVSNPTLQKEWIKEEIAALRRHAEDLEKDFENVVRARTALFLGKDGDRSRLERYLSKPEE
jgi:hypothetical protein